MPPKYDLGGGSKRLYTVIEVSGPCLNKVPGAAPQCTGYFIDHPGQFFRGIFGPSVPNDNTPSNFYPKYEV